MSNISADEAREFLRENFGEAPPELPKKTGEPNDLCIALLAYDGRMEVRTSACITQSAMKLAQAGRGVTIVHRDGDSMVARGRSFLCSQFLENPGLQQCSDILMVDVDLTWEDPDIFTRIASYPEDIVGGMYPFKQAEPSFPHRWPWQGINERRFTFPAGSFGPNSEPKEGRLWNMMGVVPGFLKISRRCLTAIAKQKPWLEFYDKGAAGKRCWMFFDNTQRNVGVFDEGYVFCEHAQSVGFTPYIDPDLTFTHIGKKAYNYGSFAQHLDSYAGKIEEVSHDFPHVPPALIAQKLLGNDSGIDLAKEEAKYAAEHQHSDAGTPGIVEIHGRTHPAEHQPGRHEASDLNGRGRQADTGQLAAIATGRQANGLGEAAGGQSWGEIRQGANGGAGGHLPANG